MYQKDRIHTIFHKVTSAPLNAIWSACQRWQQRPLQTETEKLTVLHHWGSLLGLWHRRVEQSLRRWWIEWSLEEGHLAKERQASPQVRRSPCCRTQSRHPHRLLKVQSRDLLHSWVTAGWGSVPRPPVRWSHYQSALRSGHPACASEGWCGRDR